jgi:hypothetical protein
VNLNAVAGNIVSAVNPWEPVIVRRSAGYSTAADGSRTPLYETAYKMRAQVQPLTYTEIQHLDGLNIQGRRRAAYVTGHWDGLQRDLMLGGDLITFYDTSVWLVVLVAEGWPEWCRVVLTLQNGS